MGYIYLFNLNGPAKAEEHLRQALQFNPHNRMAHANLAELFKRRKDYAQALEHFQAALKLDPKYINGHNELAMLYLTMAREALDAGHAEAGEELAEKAHEAHQQALGLVQEGQAEHRAEVARRFAQAAQEAGIGEKRF
jgi:tetratricopeptide (TPR) repeat protein